MTTLNDIVDPWLLEEDSDDLLRLKDQLSWLSRHLFRLYEPSQFSSFEDRLVDWLENVPEGEDRRAMFRLLAHLFFVGERQFHALSMNAFNDQIIRWLIDEEGIPLTDSQISRRLAEAVRRTWFCPITDSMDINAFLKVNNLPGQDVRGDWRSLERLGDPEAIRRLVDEEGKSRIVFLEDFVGTGDQMRDAVLFARDTLPTTPILLAPLICCPEGLIVGGHLARKHKLTFAPVLSLREESFVAEDEQPDEPPEFTAIRPLIERVRDRLGRWSASPYGHGDTGALIAMQTNCPDNTLAIIHEQNEGWNALFPRVRRD